MPLLQPLQSYYPAARVRLIVRFEEYGDDKGTPPPPKRPPQVRRGTKDAKNPDDLKVETDDQGRLILVGPGDVPNVTGSPQQAAAALDEYTTVIEGIIPQSANLQRNGIHQADHLTLSIQAKDFPFDPRVVRSCAVEFFLGTVTADDFARGIHGETRSDSTPSGIALPANVIADEWTDSRGRLRSNLRFQGWVDEFKLSLPDKDAPSVDLECTDNTRLLLEQDAPPQLSVGTKETLDKAVAQYLASFPQFRGLGVAYRPATVESDIPVLGKSLARTAFPPKLGPSPAGGGSGGLKVWGYLTDVCGSVGHTIRMVGSTIVIQRARTLYGGGRSSRPDDPFTGRAVQGFRDGAPIIHRLALYGENVKDLSINRKLTRFSPSNVEVRSYSDTRKKVIVARFPQKGDTPGTGRTKRINPGGAGSEQKFMVYTVAGIADDKALRAVAQGIYEALFRNELEIRVTTKNLASFGGSNADPDWLDVEAGDSVELSIIQARTDAQSTIGVVEGTLFDPERLRGFGFDTHTAEAYAKAMGNIGLQTTYRCRSVDFNWDADEGVQIDAALINYIEVRADKVLPDGEETVDLAAELAADEAARDEVVTVRVGDDDV